MLWLDCESTGDIKPYLELLQAIILHESPEGAMRLTWWATRTLDFAVYEAEIGWSDAYPAGRRWRLLCSFGEPRNLRERCEEMALRCYINSFRQVCAIIERPVAHVIGHVAWLMSKLRGPAPAEMLERLKYG